MNRARLPNCRESEVVEFDLGGIIYRAQVSRFSDGRIAELFMDAGKSGSAVQVACHDAAVAVSLALQHGAGARDLLHSLLKLSNGQPAGPVGAALAQFI